MLPNRFASSENAFNDPVQMPYFGTRLGYNGTGNMQGFMMALNAAYRYYRSAPTAMAGIPSGQRHQFVPCRRRAGGADHQAVEVLRRDWLWPSLGSGVFPLWPGSESQNRQSEIEHWSGWGELDYAHDRDTTFIARIWLGQSAQFRSEIYVWNCRLPTRNIFSTTALYLTAVRHIWGDLYMSFEWNHMMTKWTTNEQFAGDNFMLSTWYNF